MMNFLTPNVLEYLIPVLLIWIPNLVIHVFIVCTDTFMAISAGQQTTTGYGLAASAVHSMPRAGWEEKILCGF